MTKDAFVSTATSVYESVASDVMFIEVATGTGSGLLLDSNTILTAAHVFYPDRRAPVVSGWQRTA